MVLTFWPGECCKEAYTSFHEMCVNDASSTVQTLGYAIVAGAGLLKVPQILGVLRSRSAQGLNVASFELENIGFSIHTAYGFVLGLPFSAFGEAVIILLQNTFLLAIIYYYARSPLWRAFLMILLTSFGGWFVVSGDGKSDTLAAMLCQQVAMSAVCMLCRRSNCKDGDVCL